MRRDENTLPWPKKFYLGWQQGFKRFNIIQGYKVLWYFFRNVQIFFYLYIFNITIIFRYFFLQIMHDFIIMVIVWLIIQRITIASRCRHYISYELLQYYFFRIFWKDIFALPAHHVRMHLGIPRSCDRS